MTKQHLPNAGFTLVELMATVVVVFVAMGLAMGGFMLTLKNVNEGDVQNELDMDIQSAMERLKTDMRLSSLDKMFYYPEGPGPYQAISFPMAEDVDGDGLLEKDASGNIAWTKTVIYHVWPSTPHELRKTVFEPRDNSLTDLQRQAQLDEVVKTGTGVNTHNGGNTSSTTIFKNLLKWKLVPKIGRFDSYAPTLQREVARMGYALLAPGEHKFAFQVKDKNSSSSGYALGIDQLVVSPSFGEREAEAQLPATAQVGATASIQYMPGGSWKGNYQLYFPATKAGDSLTLTLDNDRWEETNFDGLGYAANNTTIVFDETLTPKDNVVSLSGNKITWNADDFATAASASTGTETLRAATIDLHLRGSDLLNPGVTSVPRCQFVLTAGSVGRLRVSSMSFGQCADPDGVSFNRVSSVPVLDSGGDSVWEIDANTSEASQSVIYDIVDTNNYVLSYTVKDDGASGCAKVWNESRANYRLTFPTGAVYTNAAIIGLAAVKTSYPETGTYASQIFDTHKEVPNYSGITWNAVVPTGTTLGMKVRTGAQPDLSDAAAWSAIAASSLFTAPNKRYVQFQAVLGSNPTCDKTPLLKDVTIKWPGDKRLVDIGGIFTKGPGYGVFEISVDGEPLRSAIIVDLEIYKDVLGKNKSTQRVTSKLQAELTPRNTGM